MKQISAFVMFLLIGLNGAAWAGELRVAVAANFQGTLQKLAEQYETAHGQKLLISAGASGALAAQIINGAPFDIFLSADTERPEQLIQSGHAEADSLFVYAYGVPVLWSADAQAFTDGEAYLKAGEYRYLAIAEPRNAPYGLAAQQILTQFELFESLDREQKLVRGNSIGQTHSQVASGAADAGFVALAQVKTVAGIPGSHWIPAADLYSPIAQAAVVLSNAEDLEQASVFLNWLQQDAQARQTIEAAGYTLESID